MNQLFGAKSILWGGNVGGRTYGTTRTILQLWNGYRHTRKENRVKLMKMMMRKNMAEEYVKATNEVIQLT